MRAVFSMMLILFCSGAAYGQSATQNPATVPATVIISIDGFRHDYIEHFDTPALAKLSRQGVRALRMKTVYPSKTFPNHISIATGLLPSHHGIVGNRFCDKQRQQCYAMGKGQADTSWVSGTPLWNLAELQGVKAATYYWPESDARFNGRTASYFYPYSSHGKQSHRVEQIIQWLKLPKQQRPKLIMSYFSEVDSLGHKYGPNAPQTKAGALGIDRLIGELWRRINTELDTEVNLIVVSDHGMSEVNPDAGIPLASLNIDDGFKVINSGTRVAIYQHKASTRALQALRERLHKQAADQYQVMSKEQLAQYGVTMGPRQADIVLQTRPPVVFTQPDHHYLGTHGFIDDDNMDAVFLAVGPSFHQGKTLAQVRNLDIYPMVAHILGLEILTPIDSDGATLWPALLSPPKREPDTRSN
ncbi:alkaline phosphatase family protein [Pseudoalteromonas ruthenica]|uniref:alkaline phosphatase family protein n=1 Tax=Pseudoalteromonas ruthenica TaxID=151081 RepID=UPI0011089C69|nr:ectonucleotide pyrophosphatase/phosphodiesterase [Pseudoalteromonas ruthenica]TLX49173.1 alkaline phosphatase family protein [Pseudoalteromonas ruthenica]